MLSKATLDKTLIEDHISNLMPKCVHVQSIMQPQECGRLWQIVFISEQDPSHHTVSTGQQHEDNHYIDCCCFR